MFAIIYLLEDNIAFLLNISGNFYGSNKEIYFIAKFFHEDGKKSMGAYFKGSCKHSCAILLISAR